MSYIRIDLILLSLVIGLSVSNAQTVTTLQPGPAEGKDALIKSCVPCGNWNMNNYGAHQSLPAVAWTNGGNISNIRALVAFDLDTIPIGSTLIEARLSLYHDPSSNEGQHSTMSGPNNCLIQRIVAPWDEMSVTWNSRPPVTQQNQIVLPASTSVDQDFPDIDVTDLVADMLQDPNGSHGFSLQMANESSYRRVVLASSDHPDPSLWPKLVLTYQNNVGIRETGSAMFRIHPNPTVDMFFIDGPAGGMDVQVFDLLGNLLRIERLGTNEPGSVDLSGLPRGSYLVRLSKAGHTSVHRLVLQ